MFLVTTKKSVFYIKNKNVCEECVIGMLRSTVKKKLEFGRGMIIQFIE